MPAPEGYTYRLLDCVCWEDYFPAMDFLKKKSLEMAMEPVDYFGHSIFEVRDSEGYRIPQAEFYLLTEAGHKQVLETGVLRADKPPVQEIPRDVWNPNPSSIHK